MQIEHIAGSERSVLATEVSLADSLRKQLQGVMFKSSLPEEYGLVFPFDDVTDRGVHMLFVRVPIDVIWTVDEEVTAVKRLQPWTGYAQAKADQIIELPAGTAEAVSPGDQVRLAE